MSVIVSSLSATSLNLALEAIAKATSDAAVAEALTSAAALIQNAVLSGQAPDVVRAAIDGCSNQFATQLAAVLDRAVSFTQQDDGSTLGLWLMPVVVSAQVATPSVIHLETSSMNGLKAAALLQGQLGLAGNGGWTYALPMLISMDTATSSDLSDLINLPQQVNAMVRGEAKSVAFGDSAPQARSTNGRAIYFLPFVAKHPAGLDIDMPAPDERVNHRVHKWIRDSLTVQGGSLADVAVHVAPQPHPFAAALPVGERMLIDVRVREMLTAVCDQVDIRPNGLAALVAPYVTKQMNDTYVLGISLISRLTSSFVATLSLVVDFDDTEGHIVGMTSRILEEVGMQVIQLRHEPIDTISCQHCGHLQFAMPAISSNHSGTFADRKMH